MRIDPGNPTPIFQQIVDRISAAVAAGTYRPGEMIPSVRQQAIALLVNPNTVARAYEHLERQGLLVSRRGNGMEVANGAPHLAAARARAAVETSLVQAVRVARAAAIRRSETDALYRAAWQAANADSEADQPEAAS